MQEIEDDGPIRSLSWIFESRLAIGNFGAAQDAEFLKRHGIRSVLGLTDHLSGKTAEETGLERLLVKPLIDGAGNSPDQLVRIVDELAELVEKHPPVLVHCHAGRSRSVVVVAGYLVRTHGMRPDDSIALIAARRDIAVSAELVALLEFL